MNHTRNDVIVTVSCCQCGAAFSLPASKTGLLNVCRDCAPVGAQRVGDEPAAASTVIDCPECHGCGVIYDRNLERAGWLYPPCTLCCGTGVAPSSTLVRAA